MDWFPYAPRPFQAEALALVSTVARDGGHLALEAPTGSGKTVILLGGSLATAIDAGRRILYVTRTNSQQEQAVRELSAIQRKTGRRLRVFALQGRHRLCLKLEDSNDPELQEASAEELGHYCSGAKRATETDPQSNGACRFYSGLLSKTDEELDHLLGREALTAEAFKAVGRANGFCSYEATKRLLPEADVVVAPYVFAFDPGLRQRLFQWWRTDPERIVLIVDEAHNLPPYLRELSSPRLGKEALRRALSESESLHHPVIGRDLNARALLEALAEIMDAVIQQYAQGEDGFIPPYEVETELMSRFRATSQGLLQAAEHLGTLGEVIKDRRRLQGRIPRSALAHVGAFLQKWILSEESAHVKLAIREPRPYLESFCVDATAAAAVLQEFHATVHASGTLSPLAEYRDTMGLGESARLERFPSPFPSDRLRIVVARGLTTRYEQVKSDPQLVDRLQESVRAFLAATRVSVAAFFPSHQMLEEFREVGAFDSLPHQLLMESRDLSQEGLMQMVQTHRSAPGRSLIAGVIGGRLSEGLDFPGRQLEAILCVGVPFPKPTARQRSLFRYYEARHAKGWDYAVRAPALRRLRQALGRLIRSAEDRGFAAVFDERAHALLEEAGIEAELLAIPELLTEYRRWQSQPAPAR